MDKKICNIFSMYGPTDSVILCQDSSASSWLSFEPSWPYNSKLHVTTYALYTQQFIFRAILPVSQ